MRKLILARGAPGAGKSTIFKQAGLEAYTLSMDTLRMTKSGPVMLASGHIGISQEHNDIVFAEFQKLTGGRMMRGELLAPSENGMVQLGSGTVPKREQIQAGGM